MCKNIGQKGSAAMLVIRRSEGVAPEAGLSNPLCASDEAYKPTDPPWLWSQGQTSPEVQHKDISGPTKRVDVLQSYILK